MFSAKAPMRITMARTLAKTGAQVDAFLGGIVVIGAKLGPIVWQFDPVANSIATIFAAFLSTAAARRSMAERLRHVLDVRVASFVDADFIALARRHGMATVFTDSDEHPSFADVTADFVYARLMRSRSEHRDRLYRGRAEGLGRTRPQPGRAAGNPTTCRRIVREAPPVQAARGVRLLHQQCEGTQPGGGDGVARATRRLTPLRPTCLRAG